MGRAVVITSTILVTMLSLACTGGDSSTAPEEKYTALVEEMEVQLAPLHDQWADLTSDPAFYDFSTTVDRDQYARIAERMSDAYTEGRERLLQVEMPDEVRSEHEAAIAALTHLELAYDDVGASLRDRDTTAMGRAVDDIVEAIEEWDEARPLLGEALGLPAGEP